MTDDPEDFWHNRMHWCSLAAGFQAYCEGRLQDSAYVKELAYRSYERGEFRDRLPSRRPREPSPS
jgi:hypothetical protein